MSAREVEQRLQRRAYAAFRSRSLSMTSEGD
jgi:hypothetical protein